MSVLHTASGGVKVHHTAVGARLLRGLKKDSVSGPWHPRLAGRCVDGLSSVSTAASLTIAGASHPNTEQPERCA